MDSDRLRTIISALGRDAFTSCLSEIFEKTYAPHFRPATVLGPLPCFFRTAPLGGYPIGMGSVTGLYIIDHLPLHLISNPDAEALRSPQFVQTIEAIKKRNDHLDGVFIFNNSVFLDAGRLQEFVLPAYDSVLMAHGLEPSTLMVGNSDSIADEAATLPGIGTFLQGYEDGLSIELTRDGPRVSSFIAQSFLRSSGKAERSVPLEPLLVRHRGGQGVLQEFERLLASAPTEQRIEEFLYANYREIFGFKYTKIERQTWLRLPSADISQKNRRLDILIRNSVSDDWDLFELKRSSAKLVGRYRDVPRMATAVHDGINQVENYLRVLSQNDAREALRVQGIDYCQPTAHLVIGRRPSMSREEWRWLVSKNRSPVKIVTYDDLIADLKARLSAFDF